MKVGSLFSGIGGFDKGLNMSVSWQVEMDKDCNRVLAHHWPETQRYQNVKEVGNANLAPVDLICGGFPCQDLSVAGKRKGLDGERSGLWFEFARIIDELEPSWVLIENVPGLLSSGEGWDFAIILQWLAGRRYCLAWRVFDSQYFGVAQRRKRVFIVASFGNGRCAEVLFESSCCCGDTPPGREAGQEVAGTIGGGSTDSRRGYRADLDTQGAYITPTICQESEYGITEYENAGTLRAGRIPEHQMIVTPTLRGGSPGGSTHGKPSGTDQGPFVVGALACNFGPKGHDAGNLMCNQAVDAGHIIPVAMQVQWASGGGKVLNDTAQALRSEAESNYQFVAIQDCREIEKAQNGLGINDEGVAYTIDKTGAQGIAFNYDQSAKTRSMGEAVEQAPSMRSCGGIAVAKAMQVRRLTPTECLRLQGFPDNWLDLAPPLSDSAKYRMVGNAVTVDVIRWIGRRIMEIE